MGNTHKGYDICFINETKGKTIIGYRLYEGYYENYINEDNVEMIDFVRVKSKYNNIILDSPVSDIAIKEVLTLLTNEFSTLPMVEGC